MRTQTALAERRWWAALAVGLCVAVLTPAAKASPAVAEREIEKGIALRTAGKDFDALPHFQRAMELAPTPRANAQLGLCEYALGRWVDAEAHLEKALEAADDPWIKKSRAVLDESLREVRKHVAQIELRGEPPGARVTVNGAGVGTLPLPKPSASARVTPRWNCRQRVTCRRKGRSR